jgi:aryl carrier-like protein
VDELPKGATGKTQRSGMAALLAQALAIPYERPASDMEKQVAAVMGEVLGRESVGRHDNFFAMGGDSLRALRFLARLEVAVAQKIPLTTFFANPTIQALALQLESGESSKPDPVIPIQTEGAKPPLFFFYGDVIPGPAFCFELGRRLGVDQPLYVVSPGDVRNYPAHPSLEETANALIQSAAWPLRPGWLLLRRFRRIRDRAATGGRR